MSKKLLKKFYNGHFLYRVIPDPRYLTLLTNGYGTLLADALSGYSGSVVHLTATPDEKYKLKNYDVTGASIEGNDLTFAGEDCTAKANFERYIWDLSLQNNGHGSIGASKLTGQSGDTITLSNTPNTDYVFSGYSVTGASLNGSILTMNNQDATAKAWFSQKQNFNLTGGNFRTYGVNITASTMYGSQPVAILRPVMSYKNATAYPNLTTQKNWYISNITSVNTNIFTPSATKECVFEGCVWYELRFDGYNASTTAAYIVDDVVVNSASGTITEGSTGHFKYNYLDSHNFGTAYNPKKEIRFEIYTNAPARLVSLDGSWRCSGYYI